MEDVKVRFPDGRINYMPRQTAMRREVVQMGGHIVEQAVKIPKSFAPIIAEDAPIETAPVTPINDPAILVAEKPKRKRKTRSDKGTKKHAD